MLPGPTNVSDDVIGAMSMPFINHRSKEFAALYSRIREKSQSLFQTSNEIVVMSGSGTVGIDAALNSVLQNGDISVAPAYGEFSSRIGDSAKFSGASVIAPASALGSVPSLEAVEKALDSADSRVRKALCVVYNETSTGVTWRKLKELKDIATNHEALFIVDAISIMGGDELPVDKLGIDICITGSQKCIAAPAGLAILSVSENAKKRMNSVGPRSQYLDLNKYLESSKRGELPYTPALPLFYALDRALERVLDEGLDQRFLRHRLCSDAFYSAFESIGLTVLANRETRSRTVLGIVYPKGIDDNMFRDLLADRFGVLVAGGFGELKGKMFRIGCMGEVNPEIVTATINSVVGALNVCGYECDSTKALNAAWKELASIA